MGAGIATVNRVVEMTNGSYLLVMVGDGGGGMVKESMTVVVILR